MRSLAVSLLALLLVPAGAGAKDPEAPVRVLWNSHPGDARPDGSWDARLSLLQGPGGFYEARARPVIVLTELAGGAGRRVPMVRDLSANTFRATVTFPRAGGRYKVTVEGFDPRHPARTAGLGTAVRVEPRASVARAATSPAAPWPWIALGGGAIVALLAGAFGIKRARMRPTG
jgi:hypothetical protein